jgi:hypothetical protein
MTKPPHSFWLRAITVIGCVLICGVEQAAAQLRSLQAIRYATLAPPPPGAERLHAKLSDFWRNATVLVEPPDTLEGRLVRGETSDRMPAVLIDARSRAARCKLRTNLPRPRPIGLECADYAGQHVGTVRSSTYDELWRWIVTELGDNMAAARPLTTVRYIFVASIDKDPHNLAEYVKQLLRAEGTFTVLDSDERLTDDQEESSVWCDIWPSPGRVNDILYSRFRLRDRYGNTVRTFDAFASGRMALFPRRSLERRMRLAVDQLLAARAEDAEIYGTPDNH